MKYNFILSLICICLIGISCGDNYQEQQKEHDLVMEIHDDVMPKLGDIHRIGRALKKITQEKNNPLEETVKKEALSIISQLEKADEGMMSWMSNYQKPKKDMPKQEALNYLAKEKETITKVRTDMLESIKVGEALLAKLQE